jgi:dihydrolipoamide dehydrogenase
LNFGCIPSKALLHIAGLITKARNAKDWGVDFGNPNIDLKRLNEWKEGVVSKFAGGLALLCKQRGISYVAGRGVFVDSNTIKISEGQSIVFDHCVIATGSRPFIPDHFSTIDLLVLK